MAKWSRWVLVGALIALPTIGYGVTKARARAHCPIKAGCHCTKK